MWGEGPHLPVLLALLACFLVPSHAPIPPPSSLQARAGVQARVLVHALWLARCFLREGFGLTAS